MDPRIARAGTICGAGDAFTAVLIHGLLADWPSERIAVAANLYAAAVASHRGATPQLGADEIAAVLAA